MSIFFMSSTCFDSSLLLLCSLFQGPAPPPELKMQVARKVKLGAILHCGDPHLIS